MLIEDAKKIKRDAAIGDELVFPLENKADFGRIAARPPSRSSSRRSARREGLGHERIRREGR